MRAVAGVLEKLQLVKWGWLSGTISLLIGGFISAAFLALFNYLTPSGRVTVTGRVVEATLEWDRTNFSQSRSLNRTSRSRGQHAASDRSGAIPVQGDAIGVERRDAVRVSTMTMPSSAHSSAARRTSGIPVTKQSEADIVGPGDIGKVRRSARR